MTNHLWHRFDPFPEFVCLECGTAVFGPLCHPATLHVGRECDICATPTSLVHGSAFRDYEAMRRL